MTAIAPQSDTALPGHQAATAIGAKGEYQTQVLESSGDQPWAEFCKGLKEPAFLLAVTDLEDLD